MTSIKGGHENGGNSHNVYKRNGTFKDFTKSMRKRGSPRQIVILRCSNSQVICSNVGAIYCHSLKVRRSFIERVSLEGICRIFDASMPWAFEFMRQIFETLLENLNAIVLIGKWGSAKHIRLFKNYNRK